MAGFELSTEEERPVDHAAPALMAWVDALLARAAGDADRIAVAIEVPRGMLVEWLVERGIAVYAINPKQLDRFRDRFTMAGAKDDRRDAWVLADSLRTDRLAFRRVRLEHPLVLQLREWSRVDEELQIETGRLTNRLRELVYRIAPEVLDVCPAADEAWFWAFWGRAPTPTAPAASHQAPTGSVTANAPCATADRRRAICGLAASTDHDRAWRD